MNENIDHVYKNVQKELNWNHDGEPTEYWEYWVKIPTEYCRVVYMFECLIFQWSFIAFILETNSHSIYTL